jgi:DNA-binding CsgD family transcriptional regulator
LPQSLREAYYIFKGFSRMSFHTAPRRIVAWLAQSMSSAGPKFDFQKGLQDICRSAGAKHAAFTMRHVPGVTGDDPYHVDTFGESWKRHAATYGFDIAGHIGCASERAIIPFDWAEMPRNRVRIRRFCRDFQQFQLGRQALTVTFRGPAGDRSLLTLTSDTTDKRWQAIKHDLAGALSVLHPAFHHMVLRVKFGIEDFTVAKLTTREKECLVLAAHGKTSKEISENLGLTPSTVNFFIDAAVGKLAASNRAHAAAKAVALGLIAPPR